jgi:hypothetical protein
MTPAQQAIFTWPQDERSTGYRLAGASRGLSAADRQELAAWGPGHDSLFEPGPEAESLNFFPLPSGAYCLSRTVRAGRPGGDGGQQPVYTCSLIVTPQALERLANHPLALARAADAAGAFQVLDEIPQVLEPLELPELSSAPAPAIDEASLMTLAQEVGPWGLARMVEAARQSACLAVAGPVAVQRLIGGLLDCLPPSCRPAFSFSTGLKHSSRRPFRIVALPPDPAAREWLAHQRGVAILDLTCSEPRCACLVDNWARLIERVLTSGQLPLLAAEFARLRPDLAPADLPAMGLQLLESLETSALASGSHSRRIPDAAAKQAPRRSASEPALGSEQEAWRESTPPGERPETAPRPTVEAGESCRRSHAAHHRFGKTSTDAAAGTVPPPSVTLAPDSPRVLERLEALDDAVFEGMAGSAEAIQRLGTLWPAVRAEVGDALLAESREHYLRFALSIWQECLDNNTVTDPTRAIHALDVLCVLFDEA